MLLNTDPRAIFSPDRKYRYVLQRSIAPNRWRCLFIMLNPSTADESVNDPTIGRCVSFARAWGYGELVVCNLFALRSTNPRALHQELDPVGPDNDQHIIREATLAFRTVLAWGNHGSYRQRDKEVLALLPVGVHPKAFAPLTKEHAPRHPLYVRGDAQLVSFGTRTDGGNHA